MQSKVIRRHLSAVAWREMVLGFKASGLSAEVFSARENVSLASLKRWVKELAAGEAKRSAPGFVDLGSLRGSSSRLEVRLDLGDGVLLTLSRA